MNQWRYVVFPPFHFVVNVFNITFSPTLCYSCSFFSNKSSVNKKVHCNNNNECVSLLTLTSNYHSTTQLFPEKTK